MGPFNFFRRLLGATNDGDSSGKAPDYGISDVLVPVSGHAYDSEVILATCKILAKPNGNLYIVYVIEVERGLELDSEITPASTRGEEVLKHMEEITKPYKINVQAEILQSRKAGAAIVQEAVEKQVGAIVIGTPYEGGFGTFSLEQTSSYILTNAPCRVIVWREPIA